MADVALVTSATLMASQRPRGRGPRRHGPVGPGGVHHPAAGGLVLVRAPRGDPPHLRPDHPRARRRARTRGHGARRARRASRRPRGRHRWRSSGSRGHELEQLETAALLHHLGQVCLDEPDDGRAPEPVAVAQAGATVLRGTQLLAPAGDIIAAETMPFREKISSRPSVMSGQILKVASAFDELSRRATRARRRLALEALCSAPGYLYDSRVLAGARGRARPARPARRSVADVVEAGQLASPRRRGTRLASKQRSSDPEADDDVADRELLVGHPGQRRSRRRGTQSSCRRLGPVLDRLLDRDVDFPSVDGRARRPCVGIPWLSAMTSTLSAIPTAMIGMPLTFRFMPAERRRSARRSQAGTRSRRRRCGPSGSR